MDVLADPTYFMVVPVGNLRLPAIKLTVGTFLHYGSLARTPGSKTAYTMQWVSHCKAGRIALYWRKSKGRFAGEIAFLYHPIPKSGQSDEKERSIS
ncbi:MAG: hypothetical protein IKP82_06360 [Oscillospiraceae bacterium]|nr:hypothetical protein [Oscillospiraceae bacterium]